MYIMSGEGGGRETRETVVDSSICILARQRHVYRCTCETDVRVGRVSFRRAIVVE